MGIIATQHEDVEKKCGIHEKLEEVWNDMFLYLLSRRKWLSLM